VKQLDVIYKAVKAGESYENIDVDVELRNRKQLLMNGIRNWFWKLPMMIFEQMFALLKYGLVKVFSEQKRGLMHVFLAAEPIMQQYGQAKTEVRSSVSRLWLKAMWSPVNAYQICGIYELKYDPSKFCYFEGASFWSGVGDRGDAAMIVVVAEIK